MNKVQTFHTYQHELCFPWHISNVKSIQYGNANKVVHSADSFRSSILGQSNSNIMISTNKDLYQFFSVKANAGKSVPTVDTKSGFTNNFYLKNNNHNNDSNATWT